jgi:DNA-binding transcriptional LysR family regulator
VSKRNMNELVAFIAVAREGSFTRAAASLGVSQSALSQTIRGLEERLKVRLLTRSTRSLSLTAAGEKLYRGIGPHFDEIEAQLDTLSDFREKPAGTVRITSADYAARNILLRKIMPLLHEHPDLKLEIDVNYGFRDIVADRFDAGVRLGGTIDKDMVAVPIGPALRMAAVAAPTYLARHPPPKHPRDLAKHICINLRFPTHGNLYVWDFEKRGQKLNVKVDGQLTFNTTQPIMEGAVDGLGIAYLPECEVAPLISEGHLVRFLEDWCPPFPGYYLYYPTRRQLSAAFALVLSALRI